METEKYQDDGAKVTSSYQEGDYFGELALTNKEPLKTSVKAVGAVKLASVSKMGLKRFLGNMLEE